MLQSRAKLRYFFLVHHASFTEILKPKKYKLLLFINKHEEKFES